MFHVWIAQSVRDLCICEYARGRHDDVAHWQEIGRSARLAKDIRQLQFSRYLFDFDDAITLRFTHANDFRADVRQALMGSVFLIRVVIFGDFTWQVKENVKNLPGYGFLSWMPFDFW